MNWKKQLYENYMSSGQAPIALDEKMPTSDVYINHIIEKFLPKNKNSKIIDLACGTGRWLNVLKHAGYTNIAGSDISPESVNFAQKNGLNSIELLPIDNFLDKQIDDSIDVILLIDILEHLEKQELFDIMNKVQCKIKKDGIVIIHVPNGEGIFWGGVYYGDFTHVCAFTQQSAKQVFSTLGFSQIRCYEDRPIPHGLKSFLRFLIWKIGRTSLNLLLTAETGNTHNILSRNLLVVLKK